MVKDAVLVGDEFKVAGSADLLLHVGPGGAVSQVDIEHVSPANALTHEQASDYAGSLRFRPTIRDGAAVATLVRTSVHFAPDSEAVEHPPAWFRPAPSGKDARAEPMPAPPHSAVASQQENLPAPKYPADAVAKKISGKVVLLVDVATDGNVKHVEVESSQPAGCSTRPRLMRRRIGHSTRRSRAASRLRGASGCRHIEANAAGDKKTVPIKVPVGTDPSAYDWIKYDVAVDKDIRRMNCNLLSMENPQSDVAYCGRLKRTATVP